MNELQILATPFGVFSVTSYSLMIMLGAVLGIALALLRAKQANLSADRVLSLSAAVIAGAVIGGRALYCATMIDYILADFGGADFIPRLWEGGYTLYGAVLGGMAAIALYAKVCHENTLKLLDFAAPGAALAIAVGRAGEYFTSQGLGRYLEGEALCRFPFGVQGPWGDWQILVFMYEALGALIICVVLCVCAKKLRVGRTAATFIILLGLTQIIFDSWREDDFIRFGFVHLNQLAAAITLGIIGAISVVRGCRRTGGFRGWQLTRTVLFLVGVLLIIGIEFALDKTSIPDGLLYVIMALTLVMMGVCQMKEE